MAKKKKTIAIDFDGTIVEYKFPKIGRELPLAFHYMKLFQDNGASIILLTMRDFEDLDAAVDFCRERGVEFYAINKNPSQIFWTISPKVYANIYIDDHGIGIPLIYPEDGKPYVDWSKVGPMVLEKIEKEW